MIIDATDERMRVRLNRLSEQTYRLTIDYPREEAYRRRVLAMVRQLLTPVDESPDETISENCSEIR